MALSHRPLVFLDVETTGTSAAAGRVIEVGAVRVERGKIVGSINSLVYPETTIPWFITKLTNITNEDLWDQPTFAGIADDLEALLQDAIFVAHNVAFDYGFIQAEFKRLKRAYASDRFCTARLSRSLYPEHRRHNLESIIQRHGYQALRRHRAYDDAYVLYQFFTEHVTKDELELFRLIDRILITHRPAAKPY